jgi:hypothetical protein
MLVSFDNDILCWKCWRCVNYKALYTGHVSRKHTVNSHKYAIFVRVYERGVKIGTSWWFGSFGTWCFIVGWIWRHQVPSKRRVSLIPRHDVTCQKTWILSNTAVSTNPLVGTGQPSPCHPDCWLSLACCHENQNVVYGTAARYQPRVGIWRTEDRERRHMPERSVIAAVLSA